MVWAHKPIVTVFCHRLSGPSEVRGKNSSSIASSAAAPSVKCVSVAMQQRAKTIFCFKVGEGERTTETHEMFETVHRKTVLEWFERFRDNVRALIVIRRVRGYQMFLVSLTVSSRPQMTLKRMRDQPHINQETISQILHRESGKRTCARFVL